MKRLFKRRLLIATTILGLVAIILAIWAFLIEPNLLIVHQETITLANWPSELDELKVAVISDIHAGSPFIDADKLRLLVDKTNDTNADVIVLLGDFVVRDSWHEKVVEPDVIAAALRSLRAPLGVYAVLGNHDWWYNGEAMRKALDSVGIRVLENEVVRLQKGDQPLWLAGLADLWTRPQNIERTIDKVPAGEPAVVLTHNPDVFPMISPTVQLTLAGHTHGGQVNFPILGRPIVPSNFGQRYAAGHIQEGQKHLFVTTGVGTSVFPVRFRVPPEIAVLTLRSVR